MKKKLIIIATFLVFFNIISYVSFGEIKTGGIMDYQKQWQEVLEKENKGLTKQALEITQKIFNTAKKQKKSDQLIKSLIYTMKYRTMIEENTHENFIYEIESDIKNYDNTTKSILTSLLAELYWQYYSENRYKFSSRTETVNFEEKDITKWDLRKFVKRISSLYLESIINKDELKKIDINNYQEILLNYDQSKKIRPTLYDFLVHRAINFFSNEEANLPDPVYKFEINDSSFFADAADFVKLKVKTKDEDSLKYKTILLFQELMAFHLDDKDPSPLIDLELERVIFLRYKSVLQEKDSLYINFLEKLYKKYENIPFISSVAYQIATYYSELGNKYVPEKKEDFKWYKKKAYDVCEEMIKKFPSTVGGINCLYLKNQILTKTFNITSDNVNIPQKPSLALLEYRNIEKLYLRVLKFNQSQEKEDNDRNKNYSTNKIVDFYLKIKPVLEWEVDLPIDRDFQTHSTEIKIPALENGYYLILASPNKDFRYEENAIAYSQFWISNISYTEKKDTKDAINYTVFDRENGNILQNVKAVLYEEKYNYTFRYYEYKRLESYTTNKDGQFTVPSKKDSRYYVVEFIGDNDRLFLRSNTYQYREYDQGYSVILKTFFFTDRAIYRPGQTIYFKGIAIESSNNGKQNKVLAGKNVSIYFDDTNYQRISQLELKTNQWGTFSGTFVAPTGRLNGAMRIYITDGSGAIFVNVEEYKRPKFEVTFDPPKESFKVNDKVAVKGFAKAYAGSNIDGAGVKYRVVRNTFFPYWYWWLYDAPSSNDTEIINGDVKTNEQGEFTINFDAVPDLSINKNSLPVFNYTVYTDVTDINGETHSSQITVRVGYVALEANINIPDVIQKEQKFNYKITSQNLNYQFEKAIGSIEIYRLKTPQKTYRSRKWKKPDKFIINKNDFDKDFPYDVYNDEANYFNWEKESKVFNSNFDTEKNKELNIDDLSNWGQGKYVLELKTKDKYGTPITVIKYFTLFSEKENKLPIPALFWSSAKKSNYQVGEVAKIEVGTTSQNLNLIYEVEIDKKIVETKKLTLSKEKKLIEFPIKEEHRGNFCIHFVTVNQNRFYSNKETIVVPWSNKDLKIEFQTFRNKLKPGEKEQWKLKISGAKGERVASEMVASLYDASLNAFAKNNWYFNIYPYYYSYINWDASRSFATANSQLLENNWNSYTGMAYFYYDALNWFGFSFSYYRYRDYEKSRSYKKGMKMREETSEGEMDEMVMEEKSDASISPKTESAKDGFSDLDKNLGGKDDKPKNKKDTEEQENPVQVRTNFNETAFFYPHLETNAEGEVLINFTIPESLTRWDFLGFAHTKDLEYGLIRESIVTQKELMLLPNVPRFFREGDKIFFSTKISNLADSDLAGDVSLQLFDSFTGAPIDDKLGNTNNSKKFSSKKGQSTQVEWGLSIPLGLQGITYRLIAKSGSFSDGEEAIVPVLTNRMLVTESIPLSVRKKGTKNFTFTKLLESGKSDTLRHEKFTFEFTPNPVWYALQSLPYIMEYPYECNEQTFARFYANSIAFQIVNSNPKIKKVYEAWKNNPESLMSNLEKNQELKSLLLEETPWVLDAKDESASKKRIGLLFETEKIEKELKKALKKLVEAQVINGGFPWFSGLPDDRYITQHIACGLGRLLKLDIDSVKNNPQITSMTQRAINYLDDRAREDYEWLVKNKIDLNKDNIGFLDIHYLYTRSFFMDVPVNAFNKKAFDYWRTQAQKYWLNKSIYMQGLIALSLYRMNDENRAKEIVASLKENSIENEEMGIYWKNNIAGYYWYQAPVETQSLLIEVFTEIAKDTQLVDAMKVWLLKQKQVQNWKTTKATTDACYALLLRGTNLIDTQNQVEIKIGNEIFDTTNLKNIKQEEGTGYFKIKWDSDKIKPEMGNISVTKKEDGLSFGAVYWQYFENLDKITGAETQLKLQRKLFLQKNSAKGLVIEPITDKTELKLGDMIIVRIEITTDRNMEYIHLKDARASALEPINVLSTHKYQDGLWYYESTKDASTNFFISYLPKGTYIFEYPLRVSQKGNFSNGITTIQCMYAPEFSSHSEGVRIEVK